jgi:hypothetical protein
MSPTCSWCRRNERSVAELWNVLHDRVAFIAVAGSLRGLSAYANGGALPFPILGEPDVDTMNSYKFSGTPTTVVVGPDGHVQKVWVGVYADSVKQEIERHFSITIRATVAVAH